MTDRHILVVEDDETTIFSWKEDILEFNNNPERKLTFVAHFATSKSEAMAHLERLNFDCAIVDLRLPSESPANDEQATTSIGNEILEKLLAETGIPAVVYSGYVQEAGPLVRESKIKIVAKRGGGSVEALAWLADHNDLMSAMAATKRSIASESAKLFNRFIWPRWETGWRGNGDQALMAEIITRQIVSHLDEELGSPATYYHPEEFYFVPPMNPDKLSTGDMISLDGETLVVVTPRCNITRPNGLRFVLLANCKSMAETWNAMRNKFADKNREDSALRELRSYAVQGHATGTHFLPPFGDRGPWLVDFKDIQSIPAEKIPDLLRGRFAAICPAFVPNLVQRLAAYIGRIGQPDLDVDVLRTFVTK